MNLNHYHLLLLMTTNFLVSAFLQNNKGMKKPIGPKLCKRLCSLTVGCSSCVYMTSDLSCHVNDVIRKQDAASGIYSFKDIKGYMFDAESGLECESNARFYLSRRKTLFCSKRRRKEKIRRLMMFPKQRTNDKKWKQLFLCNGSVVTYPYAKSNNILSAAYVEWLRAFAICDERECHFSALDEGSMSHFPVPGTFNYILVDNKKQLIFLSSQNDLYVFPGEDIYFKHIIHFRSLATDMTVDSKRSVIYVVFDLAMLSQYSYQGEYQKEIVRGSILSIYLDCEADNLYYRKGFNEAIMKMSLGDGRVTKVYNGRVDSFVVLGTNIYFSASSCEVTSVTGNGSIFDWHLWEAPCLDMGFCFVE